MCISENIFQPVCAFLKKFSIKKKVFIGMTDGHKKDEICYENNKHPKAWLNFVEIFMEMLKDLHANF